MVMRDRDVREQTPIQSGTSKGGLLRKLGAHHHLSSLCWAVVERLGGGRTEKRRGVSNTVHKPHPAIGLVFRCSLGEPVTSATTEPTARAIKMLNHFSVAAKSQLHLC